jgi:hypothetical protein
MRVKVFGLTGRAAQGRAGRGIGKAADIGKEQKLSIQVRFLDCYGSLIHHHSSPCDMPFNQDVKDWILPPVWKFIVCAFLGWVVGCPNLGLNWHVGFG